MRPLLEFWLYRLDRLGPPGQVGLALMGASLLGCLMLLLPVLVETQGLRSDIKNRSAAAAVAAANSKSSNAPDGSRPRGLRTPPVTLESEATLREVFAAASASGLELARGDYTSNLSRDTGGSSLAISLPVTGSYPAIRQFIAAILNSNSNIALEQIRLTRTDIETEELSATVRFVIFPQGRP